MPFSVDSRGGSILRLVTERRRSARSSARSSARDDIEKLRPLLTKKAQREACCQFGVLLLFMVGFIFLISLHEDIGHVFDLEYVMQIEMGREFGDHHHTIHEINDVHEIWEFIDDSFLPTMIQHQDQVGHFLPMMNGVSLPIIIESLVGYDLFKKEVKIKNVNIKNYMDSMDIVNPIILIHMILLVILRVIPQHIMIRVQKKMIMRTLQYVMIKNSMKGLLIFTTMKHSPWTKQPRLMKCGLIC